MSTVFLRDPDLKQSYNDLIQFVTHIDRAVSYATARQGTRQSRNDSTNEEDEDEDENKGELLLTTCNRGNNDDWDTNMKGFMAVRGIPPAQTSCISDVYGTTRADRVMYPEDDIWKKKFTDDSVFNLVVEHSNHVQRLANKVVVNPIWNTSTAERAIRAREFEYSIRTQKCKYDYAGFLHLKNDWFVVERITNAEKSVVQAEGSRRFLYEFISANGSSDSMAFQNVTANGTDGEIWFGVTTSSANYTGAVTGSCFGNIYAPDNLAVSRALQRGEHQTQQAADATTPSNIAILVFPLVMNLVPVALIAEVNSVGMLLYTLLTDVLTAVPLAIKGVEVLLIGKRSNRAIVTRISGADVMDPNASKAAEVWVAECKARGSYTATGVTLLAVALTAMVGGIIAEFWAKTYMSKRQKFKVDDNDPESAMFLPMQSKPTSNGPHSQISSPPASNAVAPLTSANLATRGHGGDLENRSRSRSRSRSGSADMNAAYEYGAVGAASSVGQGYEQPPSPSAMTRGTNSSKGDANSGNGGSQGRTSRRLNRIVQIHLLGSSQQAESSPMQDDASSSKGGIERQGDQVEEGGLNHGLPAGFGIGARGTPPDGHKRTSGGNGKEVKKRA